MTRITLQPRQTIVFDGDSLTALRAGPTMDQWPWLRISNNHRSWADVFAELLFAWRPELNLTFRTAAVGGSSCRNLAARFETTIAALKPHWILMTLGSNDATQGIPLEEYEEKLRTYATRVGEWGGQVVFIWIKPCPNANDATHAKVDKRAPYYAVQAKLAKELANVQVLDVGDSMQRKAQALYGQYPGHNVYSDGTHFSNLGAMILAGEVLQACGVVCAG